MLLFRSWSPICPASFRSRSRNNVMYVGAVIWWATTHTVTIAAAAMANSSSRRPPGPWASRGSDAASVTGASLDVHHGAVGVRELVAQLDEELERDRGLLARGHHLVELDRLAAQERLDQVARAGLEIGRVREHLLEQVGERGGVLGRGLRSRGGRAREA